MKLKFTFLSFALALFAQAQKAPAYYSSINFSKTKNELKNDFGYANKNRSIS